MKLTLLTCTGTRPEAFALCEKYMARQTLQPVQWIVMDDGAVPTPCTMGQEYHHVPHMTGRSSLVEKIKWVLESNTIRGDALCFIEDDDWYAKDWLELCATNLASCDVFGEGRAWYYNVQHRYWFAHGNLTHASLCATAIRKQVFPALLEEARRSKNPFIDVALWGRRLLSRRVFDPQTVRRRRTVGIKSMPGRPGYGSGHSANGRDVSAVDDLELKLLAEQIGEDAKDYAQYFKPVAPNIQTPVAPKVKSVTGQVHGPNWAKWLAPIRGKADIRGFEIGTFKGESAEWMLDNIFTHPTSKYHCVDPFLGSIEHHNAGIDCTVLESETKKRLKGYANVQFHKGFSNDVLRTFDRNFDFAYVDGAHDAMNCLRDAVMSFELLVSGGVMVFDDYEWAVFPNAIDRPKMAVDAFIACYMKEIDVLQRTGWQICVRKK